MDFDWKSSQWWMWFARRAKKPSIKCVYEHILKHDAIIVYHGCRPVDVNAYYKSGLLLSDFDILDKLAFDRYISIECRRFNESSLRRAIASVRNVYMDDSRLYVILDDRVLLKYAGHYLLYGSEYVIAVGAEISREAGMDCRQLLKTIGTPTLFRIRLPINYIHKNDIMELAADISNMWEEYSDSTESPIKDWTFTMKQSVPGSCIVSHYHPSVDEVYDPYSYDYFR